MNALVPVLAVVMLVALGGRKRRRRSGISGQRKRDQRKRDKLADLADAQLLKQQEAFAEANGIDPALADMAGRPSRQALREGIKILRGLG